MRVCIHAGSQTPVIMVKWLQHICIHQVAVHLPQILWKLFCMNCKHAFFINFGFLFSHCCHYCHYWRRKVISTGLANEVRQWLGNTNMFAQSKLHLYIVHHLIFEFGNNYMLNFKWLVSQLCYNYLCQGGYVFVIVCLLATLCKNFQTDLYEIFMEGWQWANEQMVKFWWWSGSVSQHW